MQCVSRQLIGERSRRSASLPLITIHKEIMPQNLNSQSNEKISQPTLTNSGATDMSVEGEELQICEGADAGCANDDSLDCKTVLAQVFERAAGGDCGAPFSPEALTVLLHLRDTDAAEFVRVRTQLKEANKKIPLAHLDRELRQHAKAAKEVYPSHHGYAKDALTRLAVHEHMPVSVGGCLFVPSPYSALWSDCPMGTLARLTAERHDGGENCFRHEDYSSIVLHAVSIASDEAFFQKAPLGVACKDSFFSVQDNRIHKDTLSLSHRQCEALEYEPADVPTPLFNALLHDTFKSSVAGEEEEQTRVLQEVAGAIILGLGARYQKAVCFFDRYGRAGKGTMQSIFQKLLPQNLVSAVPPTHWSREYYAAKLCGKRLNVVGEMPDDITIPAAEFKSVLGGDQVIARNPAGQPFTFQNSAMHLFSTNHHIPTRDHTEAFYARWLLIDFPNSLLKSGRTPDPQLAQRIISQEMSGIAYWALEGAKRLLEQGRFSSSKAHDRLMAEWRRSASSIDEFLHECCATGSTLKVRRAALYVSYKEWCLENGRKPFAKSKFADLLSHNLAVDVHLSVLDGNEIWRGIDMKSGTPAAVSIGLDPLIDF